jgi:hypothetical protein
MKKKILLIVIILIIVCIFTYYFGIYFGKKQERKKLIEENINNDTYVNNNFDFVIREKEDNRKIIPNTILKIKELDIKNKKIKISYITYDKKEDNSNRYMLGTFMLEKKIQDKWFEINAVTKLPKQTAINIENVNTGNRKEKLDNINVENANKYIKSIDIEVR